MDIKPRQLEILEAAGSILNEESISGLTTKNLARRVGFAESALYRHFGGKEEIIAALLEYLYERMKEHLSPVVQATEMLPAERLRRLFYTHLEFLSENPHFLTAIFSEGMLQYSPSSTNAFSG
jgi:AcrR family transcriptional regulator